MEAIFRAFVAEKTQDSRELYNRYIRPLSLSQLNGNTVTANAQVLRLEAFCTAFVAASVTAKWTKKIAQGLCEFLYQSSFSRQRQTMIHYNFRKGIRYAPLIADAPVCARWIAYAITCNELIVSTSDSRCYGRVNNTGRKAPSLLSIY